MPRVCRSAAAHRRPEGVCRPRAPARARDRRRDGATRYGGLGAIGRARARRALGRSPSAPAEARSPRVLSAAGRSWPLFQHLLHAEELAVAPALGRVRESLIPREARTDLVL